MFAPLAARLDRVLVDLRCVAMRLSPGLPVAWLAVVALASAAGRRWS
jgi:hypothetical protein